MRIISSYVKEQMRYTKNQLRTMFAFDDQGVEKFIKNLKSFGILKTVANNVEQKDLTELSDGDIQIMDETAGNDDCYYVFTYVGVLTCGNRVIKVFPKYLSESEPLKEMKLIMKVLERYSHSDEQIINLFSGDGDKRSFNILAVILFLLNDYFEYGVYNNTKDIVEINGEGDILWEKTIDEGFALIEDNRPYYTQFYTRRIVEDSQDYFKRLHECIITECSRQLHDAGLEDIFEMEPIILSEEHLDDFGDKEYILSRILAELNIQFNTRRQTLLKTIYTYISQDKKLLEENQGISMFGTTAFHAVWEKACAEVFGNKLNTTLGQLKISAPLSKEYDKKTKLIEIIEKPKWEEHVSKQIKEAKETLIPDLITIENYKGQDWFVIFDAKYYNLQLEPSRQLRGNPGVSDVTKQYLYQLAYRDFIMKHNIAVVKNCFLMPTEGEKIVNKGKAKLDMLSSLGLEDIQVRLIPADRLFRSYLSRKRISLEELDL